LKNLIYVLLLYCTVASATTGYFYFLDDFTTYTNNSSASPNWVVESGTWMTKNGIYRQTNLNGIARSRLRIAMTNDAYIIELKVRTTIPKDSNTKYYVAGISCGDTENICKYYVSLGGCGMLSAPGINKSMAGPDPLEWQKWKLVVINKKIEIWQNGSFRGKYNLSNEITGNLRLYTFNAAAEFDDVSVSRYWDDDFSISVETATNSVDHLFYPHQLPIVFNITGNKQSDLARSLFKLSIDYNIVDYNGNTMYSQTVPFLNEHFMGNVELNPQSLGFYKLNVNIKDGDILIKNTFLTVGVLPETRIDTTLTDYHALFGLNGTGPAGVKQKIIPNNSDKNYWRISWREMEPLPNKFCYTMYPSAPLYNPVTMICWITPEWSGITGKPADWSAWYTFIQHTALEWKLKLPNRTRVYELFPEAEYDFLWWNKNKSDFVDLCRVTVEAIKSIDNDVVILGACGHGDDQTLAWVEDVLSLGLNQYIDYIANHSRFSSVLHPEAGYFDYFFDSLNELADTYGLQSGLWLTEHGFGDALVPRGRPDGYLAKHFIISQSKGLKKYHLYYFSDIAMCDEFPYDSSGDQGIFYHLGPTNSERRFSPEKVGPKIQTLAYATLVRNYANAHFFYRETNSQEGHTIFKYCSLSLNKKITAIWAWQNPVTTELSLTGPYTISDLMGNTIGNSDKNERIILELDNIPIFINQYDPFLLRKHFNISFIDGFNYYNDGNAVKAVWDSQSGGEWQIENGCFTGKGSGVALAKTGDESWDNYTFETKARVLTSDAPDYCTAWLYIRWQEGTGGYKLMIGKTGWIALYKPNDTYVMTADGRPATTSTEIDPCEWHTWKISALDEKLSVYVDGKQIISGVDASLSRGKIALAAYRAKVAFDDVKVTSPYIFNDDFLQYVEGSTAAPIWDSQSGGEWQIENGCFTGKGSGMALAKTGDESWDNYTFETKARVLTSDAPDYCTAWLYIRWQEGTGGYKLMIGKTGWIALYKPNDIYVMTADGRPATASTEIDPCEWHTWKISALDEKLSVYVDGKLIISGVDASLSRGKIALAAYRAKVAFDEVKVTSPYIFNDDFLQYVEGSTAAPIWDSQSGGEWKAENGLFIGKGTGVALAKTGDESWDNYTFETKARVLTSDAPDYCTAWLFIRWQEGTGGYKLMISKSGWIALYKPNDTYVMTADGRPSTASTEIDPCEWHTWKISVLDEKFSVYVDGKQIISGVDASLSRGKIALAAYRAKVAFDDVKIYKL